MIAMYVKDNHKKWDAEIQEIACALRTAHQETTRVSPYFVNFGRNMCLSGDDYSNKAMLDEEDGTQTPAISKNESCRKLFSDVKRRLEVAAERNVSRYNLRKRDGDFAVGNSV